MTYRKGEKFFSITSYPGYKKKCLFIGSGNVMQKVATFTNDEAAEAFDKLLTEWFKPSYMEEDNPHHIKRE